MDQTEDEVPGVTFRDEPKTPREKLKQVHNIRTFLINLFYLEFEDNTASRWSSDIISRLHSSWRRGIPSCMWFFKRSLLILRFFQLEGPFEMHIRNATAHRVQHLKDRIIAQLWTMAKELPPSELEVSLHHSALFNQTMNGTNVPLPITRPYHLSAMQSFREWSNVANAG